MYTFNLSSLEIILVEPQIPGNVGAVARVLKNFGVNSLCLIRPCPFLTREAISRASKAEDILYRAKLFSSLEDALSNCQYVVTTTARRRYKISLLTPREIAPFLSAMSQENRIALVFGPERSGLKNEELALGHISITIPTDASYPSLNLAQAVGIVLYELFLQTKCGISQKFPRLATGAQLSAMYKHLMEVLDKIGFVQKGQEEHTELVIRRLFSKIPLEEKDIQVIRGICRQIDWYTSKTKTDF